VTVATPLFLLAALGTLATMQQTPTNGSARFVFGGDARSVTIVDAQSHVLFSIALCPSARDARFIVDTSPATLRRSITPNHHWAWVHVHDPQLPLDTDWLVWSGGGAIAKHDFPRYLGLPEPPAVGSAIFDASEPQTTLYFLPQGEEKRPLPERPLVIPLPHTCIDPHAVPVHS